MSLPNVYFLMDDTTNANGGGASADPISSEFTAPSLTAATTVAYIIASALQRPVRLVPKFGAPPYTLVQGALPTVGLTSVPSGVGF